MMANGCVRFEPALRGWISPTVVPTLYLNSYLVAPETVPQVKRTDCPKVGVAMSLLTERQTNGSVLGVVPGGLHASQLVVQAVELVYDSQKSAPA